MQATVGTENRAPRLARIRLGLNRSVSGSQTSTASTPAACTWLGFTPWNGQRRERVEFRTGTQFGAGTQYWDGDPLLQAGVERPEGVDFRKTDIDTQLTTLKEWYNTNLVPQYKLGDGQDAQKNVEFITFLPKYYFLGLSSGAQNANKGLPQTIGWQDYNNGGAEGTFDPLAE